MIIVAFGHKSRVGKNTAAKFFVEICEKQEKTVMVISFASLLKQICYMLLHTYGLQNEQFYEDNPEEKNITLKELNMTPIQIWVHVGTTLVRNQLHNDVWIRNALRVRHSDFLIITDLRFPNEAEAVKIKNGFLIKINRKNAPILDTVADKALDNFQDWDFVIENNGSLDTLTGDLEYVYNAITCVERQG